MYSYADQDRAESVKCCMQAEYIQNEADNQDRRIKQMVNVIGLGYIGLPTALMLAAHGVEVIGTDYSMHLVGTLNEGKTTFKEEGLDELFNSALKAGIRFTTEYQEIGRASCRERVCTDV